MGFKEDYYFRIREDYKLNQENSFIFKYMSSDKYPKSKNNFSTKLEEHNDALNSGNESKYDYILFLAEYLNRNPKMYYNRRNQKTKKLMETVADRLHLTYNKQGIKLDKLVSTMKKNETMIRTQLDDVQLEGVAAEAGENTLHNSIKDFFYDRGFPYKEIGKTDEYLYDNSIKDSHRKNEDYRKKDKDMNLLDEFCTERGVSFEGGNLMSDEDCIALFEILYNGDNASVDVPLQIMPNGFSLHVIGRDHFKVTGSLKSGEDKSICKYGIFEQSRNGNLIEDENQLDNCRVRYEIMDGFDECSIDYKCAKAELIERYESDEEFIEENGELPDGCPETFKRYFKQRKNEDESVTLEKEREFFRSEMEANNDEYESGNSLRRNERRFLA